MTRSDFERVFENIGSAIAILQRNDSKPMPEDIRELILEARHRLSMAQSQLLVTPIK